ncbi:similar to Saccharomyces cerevisiae YML010W SPT5 Protein involved in regulating Pol I and Pol II transcription and pre-mRNA processing [Maudiozyma barnettii]|uniref:Transcription elongation factor SPT5 n=1 Tax=Maudiozyma barnettii TaxID=61262 RepID=A0A8H2VJ89_9SACH|nr:transcription elongation factor SPT5 [Kazachstania barnettii]CAB4256350.1 similar to Saccharomyces cerevisiae YML010W SPT5 Protein involved in regulating Pol I and Pol II transcription and pre-mRNA processing [Kazachstania barnettii]CAD1784959.1 similar to Saccharomyces cerevisiae YML010W SPT5 Protein involved in regulating Pol I and Pol II transcription and pre-mRNA processing [Kazachstania barnettii]
MSENTDTTPNPTVESGSSTGTENIHTVSSTVDVPKTESDPAAELNHTHDAPSEEDNERTEDNITSSEVSAQPEVNQENDSPSEAHTVKTDYIDSLSNTENDGEESASSTAKRPRSEGNDDEENNNNDDDDNDDDDEEEDEDEDAAPSKRQRQERNRFLDIEAEVSDDEDEDEDEEESELVKEGFITRDDEHEEEGQGRDRLHRELDQNMNKTSEEDAQRLAKELRERYGRTSSKQYRAAAQDGYVPQRFLLPSVDTATVWGVRCRPGKEKELVKKLFKKKLNLDRAMGKKKLKILSIFQRDNYHGRIYIEAPKQSVIEKFCNGVPDIYINQKLLIPVQELPLLLKPNKSDDVTLEEGNYVRIKRGIYKGDLAMIDQISENNLEVMLKVVPRLDYGKFDEIDPTTGQRKPRRATFANRASPQLFNPTMALRLDQANLYKRDDHHFTYKNEDYIDGYLFKSFRIQYIETKNIQPSVEELARFSSKDGSVDLSNISQALKKSQASKVTFQSGDRVEILVGEQRSSKGIVTKTTTDIATVKLPQFPLKPLEFPISSLRKIFEPGDHVTVINGDHQGDAGLVLIVKQGQVTFMSNQTRQEVTITANNLSKSIDSTPTSSEYALHDIVELSAKNVACIIQAGHDIFKVLDEGGKVFTINKGSILSKINTNRLQLATIDSKGREINIGDSVIEKLGARREGEILFIQNQQVFVMSKKIIENAGVFVLNTSNIEAVASKDNMIGNKMDLSRMNPDIISKMGPPSAMTPRPQAGPAREVAVGKTVRIRSAGYKGQLGIVKDVNGDKATIELHSKNKHITVDKRKLTYYNREGGEGISYDELVNRRGRVPQGRMGPSYVSAGNPMNTGRQPGEMGSTLPGGMTPGWNNAFDGGKTPAVNSHGAGSGGTSAWGGASSWGGQTGGTSVWGSTGGSSAWGGQGTGATSTWGGASAWGNKSSYGGASSWAAGGENNGATSAWGGGAASTYGGASTWGNKEGAGSAWGGNRNNNSNDNNNNNNNNNHEGNASAWGNNNNNQQQGNRSAWGNQNNGGNSSWGST